MNARYLHSSARKNSAAVQHGPGLASQSAAQPGETDLLLCGRNNRISCRALASAGASVCELPGQLLDVASWIRATVPGE